MMCAMKHRPGRPGRVMTWSAAMLFAVTLSAGPASAATLQWTGSVNSNWDFTTANWSGDSTTFSNGDDVTFAATTGAKAVNILGGGVAPGSMTVGATGYSFTGGPIAGSTGIVLNAGATFNSANTFTGDLSLGNNISVTATASDALGAGTVKTTAGTVNNVVLNTNTQTQATDFNYTAARLIFTGNAPVATVTGNLTGGTVLLQVQSSGVLEIRGSFGTTSGQLLMNSTNPNLSISDADTQLPGNLNITSGALILDGTGWSGFSRAANQGTGVNDWQVSGTGGFAARGVDAVINTGNWDNTNFGIGSNHVVYADAAVNIAQDINLGSALTRVITVRGGNSAARTVDPGLGWNVVGPVNELSGQLTGSNVTFNLQGQSAAGSLRLSNPANSFTGTLNVLPTALGKVVVATDDGVFGDAGNTVNVGAGGTAGNVAMLMLEDQAGTGKTFARNINILGSNSVNNRAGVGSYAGDVTYTGTFTLTDPGATAGDNVGHVAFYTHGGSSFTLGDAGNAATIANNRNNATGGGHYDKVGTGELVLDNVSYTGSNPGGFQWHIYDGTLTSTAANQLSSGNLNLVTLLLAPPPSTGTERTWRVADASQTYNNVTSGGWVASPIVQVDEGITLTTNVVSGALTGPGLDGTTLRKTGGGTWIYNSAVAAAGGGGINSIISVDDGTLDLNGHTGHTDFLVNGGALLFSHDSGFTTNFAGLSISSAGGKIGVSVNATGDVTRTTTAINAWDQGGDVTFASRGNFDLVFAAASFPDITAGTVLFERDGSTSGGGVVQINDTTLSVSNATIGGSGALRLGSSGTGSLAIGSGATLAPGSSPGILTVEANVSFASDAQFAVELLSSTPGSGYDQLNVIGTIDLGGATLVISDFAFTGPAKLTIINNDASDAIVGTFAGLSEGDYVLFNSEPFATITYVGGTGNDVVLNVLPEPASAAVLGLTGLILLRRRGIR